MYQLSCDIFYRIVIFDKKHNNKTSTKEKTNNILFISSKFLNYFIKKKIKMANKNKGNTSEAAKQAKLNKQKSDVSFFY